MHQFCHGEKSSDEIQGILDVIVNTQRTSPAVCLLMLQSINIGIQASKVAVLLHQVYPSHLQRRMSLQPQQFANSPCYVHQFQRCRDRSASPSFRRSKEDIL